MCWVHQIPQTLISQLIYSSSTWYIVSAIRLGRTPFVEYFAGKTRRQQLSTFTVMPADGNFGFSVLIAGLPVPEYQKDGRYYVESNLWTPVSYKQRVRELAYGEVEEQEWPVTPYQIKVYTQSHCPLSWLDVYVDGVRVSKHVLKGGESR